MCNHYFIYPEDDHRSFTLTGVCKLCGVKKEAMAWAGFDSIPSIEKHRKQSADRILVHKGEYGS